MANQTNVLKMTLLLTILHTMLYCEALPYWGKRTTRPIPLPATRDGAGYRSKAYNRASKGFGKRFIPKFYLPARMTVSRNKNYPKHNPFTLDEFRFWKYI